MKCQIILALIKKKKKKKKKKHNFSSANVVISILRAIYCFKQVSHTEGSGKISFRILQYNNDQCLDAKGKCCDGFNVPSLGCTPGCCDHRFTIGLTTLDR